MNNTSKTPASKPSTRTLHSSTTTPLTDPVFDLINQEFTRQSEGLELIPSENHVSKAVMTASGSVLTNKYSEGYPSFDGLSEDADEHTVATKILENYRYYGGQTNIDRIERLAILRAKKLFHADHANVQPHSGANANEAVYYAWCDAGDTILAMDLSAGGHLTHGAKVTRSAHIYNFINYGVDASGDIDYESLEKLASQYQPKIILIGYSAFMKIPDFDRVAKIGQKIGALLMADMAHVAGLIAGGEHPNPLDHGFHVMTTTTHKTLRGPRGGLILSMGKVSSPLRKPEKTLENIPTLIDRAVFPGTQGGPLEHQIAAKAVAFGEALCPEFKTYAKNIKRNANSLADFLKKDGFHIVGGDTENHLLLLNVKKSHNIDGKFFEIALDKVNLTLNANAIPNSTSPHFKPDGVRLGTPAITTRGLSTPEMQIIANAMSKVAKLCQSAQTLENLSKNQSELDTIKTEIKALALKFPLPH